MNTYSLQIKQNGVWSRFEADSVFPFSWCDLLDERLDEAYITVYNSTQEAIKRTSEIQIIINNEQKEYTKYFIVAGDNSIEYPVGSGKYKHDLYLIERTKLLEGIYCSSLTFTNSINQDDNSLNLLIAAKGGLVFGDGTLAENIVKTEKMIENFCYDNNILYYVPDHQALSVISLSESVDAKDANGIVDAFLDWYHSNYHVKYIRYSDTAIGAFYRDESGALDTLNVSNGSITTDQLQNHTEILIRYTAYVKDEEDTTKYCNFSIVRKPYTVEEYIPHTNSITDVVCRMCEQAEPIIGDDEPRYKMDGVTYKGAGIRNCYTTGSDAEKYNTVLAPEFTVTQSTLREQLRTVGGYIHGEPYLDADNIVHFKPLAVTKSWKAGENLPYISKSYTAHINEYCTEIRANAQNLVSSMGYAKGVAIDPGEGLLRTIRSEQLYAIVSSENGEISTDFPIQEIIKVECGLISHKSINPKEGGVSNNDNVDGYYISPCDITAFVYESTKYNSNLSSYDKEFKSKAYAIYYTKGEKNIQGLFYRYPVAMDVGTTPTAIANILSKVTNIQVENIQNEVEQMDGNNLVFRVTYRPITNHFVSHGKQIYIKGEEPFHKPYNQSENLVESTYFGEHIKGVAARLGNIEQERTYILKYIKDIPSTGMKIGDYWITAVSCELMPYYIKCTVGLSKNYESISRHIGVNSQKRMYQISESNVYKRDIIVKNKIVVTRENGGSKPPSYSTDRLLISDLTAIMDAFRISSRTTAKRKITFAQFKGYTKDKQLIGEALILPTIPIALGNTIVFTFSMLDNYSAGNKRKYITTNDENVCGWWLDSVPYAQEDGSVSFAEIKFYHSFDEATVSVNNLWEQANKLPERLTNHGLIYEDYSPAIGRNTKLRHYVDKDNREALSYNVVLEYVTDVPDLVIGSGLASHCSLVDGSSNLGNARVYSYNLDEGDFSKFDKNFDTIGIPKELSRPVNIYASEDGSINISFVVPTIANADEGWVIALPSPTPDNVLLSGKGAGYHGYTIYITK